MRNLVTIPLVIAATSTLAACTDGAGPRAGATPVSIAFSTRSASASAAPLPAGSPETFSDGTNTLVISSVELVLREVELKRVEEGLCESESGGTEGEGESGGDGCEEVETGPILLDLPLGGGTERMFTVTVPAGTYDEVEFEIHPPEDEGDAADRDFLLAHPDLTGTSVRVKGTFNGTAFTFTSDLNAEQELALDPPLIVTEGTPATLTVRVDLGGWFRSGTTVVDPGTAAKGGPNENVVRDNIIRSFESFRDDDADGLDDDHDDADGGH